METLMVTHFNNCTFFENKKWRESNCFNGCIYNSPIYIKKNIPLLTQIYVIEMNNETNKIIGFGKIINKVFTDKKYNVYSDKNYNRYTYKGSERISIHNNLNYDFINELEKLLFFGKTHLKRGQGLSEVPKKIYKYLNLIKELF